MNFFHIFFSNTFRIKNLIFILLFICGSNFSYAKSYTVVPYLIKCNSFNLEIKDSVVRMHYLMPSTSLKHNVNKNKKSSHNVFLSIFDIDEEDCFSCSVKLFKSIQNFFFVSINSQLSFKDSSNWLFPYKDFFCYKRSKLFIDYQSFLI